MSNFFGSAQGGVSTTRPPEFARRAGRQALAGAGDIPGWSPQEQSILDMFFGGGSAGPGGGDLGLARNALSNIAQQDALGRAELLLQPSLQRALQQGQSSLRERFSQSGNLFGSGESLAEGRMVGDTLAGQQSTLAGLIPQLTQLQLGAAEALPGLTGQALGFAGAPRQVGMIPLDLLARLAGAGGQVGQGAPSFGPSPFSSLLQTYAMTKTMGNPY